MHQASTPESGSFADLETAHRLLDDLFREQQRALLAFEAERAADLLDRFRHALALHIAHEDDGLLPEYERWVAQAPADVTTVAGEIFRVEHQRLLTLLDGLRAGLREAVDAGPLTPDQVLDLLDEQSRFKRLVEHHQTREHQVLFPRLDETIDASRRAPWVRRCLDQTRAALAARPDAFSPSSAVVGDDGQAVP